MKSRIRCTLPDDLDDRPRALIRVAHLPDETMSAPRINAGEARSIILASRLIAYLAFLLWRMEWDRYFWIANGDVFIRLIDDDLFVKSETIESDLHRYLEHFDDWKMATLLKNLSTSDDPAALGKAKDVIEKTAATIAPSGQSLADVFSAWMRRFARVSAFSFLLPLGVAGARVVHMPSASRMLPSLQPRGAHGVLSEVLRARITAKTEAFRLRSADGSEYLCSRNGVDKEDARGRVVFFHHDRGSMIKSWIRASKTS